MRQVREVKVEDILGREPVRMEVERVGEYLRERVVLVTGAGGSIGSELCRQIARVRPERLVLLDHAEDNLFEIERELIEDRHALEHRLRPCGLQGGGADARGVRRAPADRRLPRRRLQARRADGEQPDRGGAQQLARHARDVPDRGRDRRARVHPRLDRQGGGAGDRDGRLEGAGRVGGRGGRRALSRDALRQRAVRQRARLVGLRGADLPPPDRGGRAGHGHRPVDDALLHDDPGGGAARHPRGLARRTAARCSCSRWASRSGSSTWRRT